MDNLDQILLTLHRAERALRTSDHDLAREISELIDILEDPANPDNIIKQSEKLTQELGIDTRARPQMPKRRSRRAVEVTDDAQWRVVEADASKEKPGISEHLETTGQAIKPNEPMAKPAENDRESPIKVNDEPAWRHYINSGVKQTISERAKEAKDRAKEKAEELRKKLQDKREGSEEDEDSDDESGDGGSGIREPRNPHDPILSGGAEVELPE